MRLSRTGPALVHDAVLDPDAIAGQAGLEQPLHLGTTASGVPWTISVASASAMAAYDTIPIDAPPVYCEERKRGRESSHATAWWRRPGGLRSGEEDVASSLTGWARSISTTTWRLLTKTARAACGAAW